MAQDVVSQQKKILVVGQHFWPESFRVNDICDFFIEKNCSVDVLCGIPNYPKGQYFEGYSVFTNRKQRHNGVNIRRAFELPRGDNSNLRIFLNYISFPLSSLLHVPRLLTRRYDKIFIFQTSPIIMAIAAIIVGKLRKTETTMYVLDLWPENLFSVLDIKNPFLRKLVATISHWHYRNTDKLIVLSERMEKRILEVVGNSKSTIVLPQACEKIYEQDIYDKNLEKKYKDGFNILFTGSITPAQSFETIIEAAKRLKSEGLGDINWIIVGDGMSRKWLEKEVKGAGLSDSFHFEGLQPVEDIPKYTTMSDMLIGCLVKSGLLEATIPAKVMSYFAAGKPLVLAMDGEVQDLINNTIKCGLAGPTGDAEVLAKNIEKIYKLSKKERDSMGKRGREYHLKYFERNIILNKLYNFMFA